MHSEMSPKFNLVILLRRDTVVDVEKLCVFIACIIQKRNVLPTAMFTQ